jgi:hypothetical protein
MKVVFKPPLDENVVSLRSLLFVVVWQPHFAPARAMFDSPHRGQPLTLYGAQVLFSIVVCHWNSSTEASTPFFRSWPLQYFPI